LPRAAPNYSTAPPRGEHPLSGNWSNRINRWLRRGPPRHYRGPEVAALRRALDTLVTAPEAEWPRLPPLAETYYFFTVPTPAAWFDTQANEVMSGTFRVAARFPVQPLGFPPDWASELTDDDNWFSSLHGLEWALPLLHAHAGHPDEEYLSRWLQLIEDWILRNPFHGAPSRFSWHDHAAAKRLRLFAWFWETYRRSQDYRPEFARLLLASVYQHALYHVDARNYRRDSNHGLEAVGALWAAALTFPMFADAPAWAALAEGRLTQWIADNLSPEGFHLEQSPSYHWFVLLRLVALDRFLRANGQARPLVTEAAERAARAWPRLLQPNGTIPGIGDSSRAAPAKWEAMLAQRWGRPASEVASAPPASDFTISPRAGYAVFRAGPGGPEDTYLLFRCRAFISPHCHYDALSFTLYGLNREWVVDSGFLNYHEWDPRRAYLRSPRAHSLVLVNDRDARTGPCEVTEWGRSDGDYVTAFHDLPSARHTRSVQFAPPRQVMIRDEIHTTRRPLPWAQLYQVAPDLEVRLLSDHEAHLVAPGGAVCTIHQSLPGHWEVVSAQTAPVLQGWYSEAYGKWAPGKTLVFRMHPGASALTSTLRLRAAGGGEEA